MHSHVSTRPGIGKEKLVFLACALLCAFSVYRQAATRPAPLDSREPISAATVPAAIVSPGGETRNAEKTYLSGGRKSPFMAARAKIPIPPIDPRFQIGIPPPTLDQTVDSAGTKKPKSHTFDPSEIPFTWMGRVVDDGAVYGLLRARDGSAPIHVQPGDRIPAHGLTVSNIAAEGIWLTDRFNRRMLVKNTVQPGEQKF